MLITDNTPLGGRSGGWSTKQASHSRGSGATPLLALLLFLLLTFVVQQAVGGKDGK